MTVLFVCNRRDTTQYHYDLRSMELGQAPMLLVFQTPRQELSSHPHQQMVWLSWLQDKDSMPNWYNINHPTTLHSHNETQWPTAAPWWHFVLRDVSCRQSCHLLTPQFDQPEAVKIVESKSKGPIWHCEIGPILEHFFLTVTKSVLSSISILVFSP